MSKILGVVEMVDCVQSSRVRIGISEDELAFGDYSNNRWGWKLSNIRRLKTPIPARGALGLWRWTPPAEMVFTER